MTLSCLEVYNENIYDLLNDNNCNNNNNNENNNNNNSNICNNKSKFNNNNSNNSNNNNNHTNTNNGLKIRTSKDKNDQTRIVIVGLTQKDIVTIDDFCNYYQNALNNRHQAFTKLNAHSSRSHAIYTLQIIQFIRDGNEEQIIDAKFSIVDLAGSENNKHTGNKGDQLQESCHINTSLSALQRVIHKLNQNAPHIPYRDSELTRLLQDSLGGNACSSMICCISSITKDILLTKKCLEFGAITREIKNIIVPNIINQSSLNSTCENKNDEKQRNKENIECTHSNNKNSNNNSMCQKCQCHSSNSNNNISGIIHLTKEEYDEYETKVQNLQNECMQWKQKFEKNLNEKKEKKKKSCRNDEHGLPPATPATSSKIEMANKKCRKAREAELTGNLYVALQLYSQAHSLATWNMALENKILELKSKLPLNCDNNTSNKKKP